MCASLADGLGVVDAERGWFCWVCLCTEEPHCGYFSGPGSLRKSEGDIPSCDWKAAQSVAAQLNPHSAATTSSFSDFVDIMIFALAIRWRMTSR